MRTLPDGTPTKATARGAIDRFTIWPTGRLTTFLDHPACWRRAARFAHAEALPAWRKRTHLPHVLAAVDAASLQVLAAGLSTYFRRTEGRGTHCVVEPVRLGSLDYFFAYREDYAQHSVEWVDGQFGQRPHHPAFEVIYVYSQPDGTLDVNIRGARAAVEPLQGLFAGNPTCCGLRSQFIRGRCTWSAGIRCRTRDGARGTRTQ